MSSYGLDFLHTKRVSHINVSDSLFRPAVILDADHIHTKEQRNACRKSHDAIAKFKGLKNSVQGDSKIEDRASKLKPIRVLLMLIQHGANGLNILEAQHVILVEPLLNPAAEAQAISRVHRVGQEKQTFVHRFIVRVLLFHINQSSNMFILLCLNHFSLIPAGEEQCRREHLRVEQEQECQFHHQCQS